MPTKPTKPTTSHLTQLKTALRNAFTHAELTQLTRTHLEFPLEWFTPVAGQRDLTTIVDELVAYAASQEDGLRQLLTAAVEERPENDEIRQIEKDWSGLIFAPIDLPKGHPAMTVDTRGGMANSGSIQTDGGQVIGRDKTVQGDEVGRDKNTYNYFVSGEKPPLYVNVPNMPNHFVGRDGLMSQIVDQLTAGLPIALSAEGLPGVGKTTMAVAVAHHTAVLSHFSDGILWAGLGPNGDVMSRLAAWADALGVDVSSHVEPAQRAAAVKNAIGLRKVLLIIDDAWETDAAQALRCGGPHCCHLLTTRDQQIARTFAGSGGSTAVPTLAEEPAYDLLRQLAPAAWEADPQQGAGVEALVDNVGHLPLAIELLGGYLNAETHSASLLFADLQQDALADLDDPARRLQLASQRLGDRSQTTVTLQATIELSLASLPDEAQQVFYRLGAFAAQPHTFDLDAAKSVAQTESRTLALLAARNLLEASDAALSLHQTIGDVARTQTSPDDQSSHCDYYLEMVNQDRGDWQRIEPAYGQIQWAWDQAGDDEARKDLTYTISTYQLRRGLYAERIEFLIMLLDLARQSDWRYDETNALNDLGQVYHYLGRYQEALDLYEQSLQIRQDIGDKSGEGTTLNNISQIFKARGDTETALRYLKQLLEINQELGDRVKQGIAYNNIAEIFKSQGDHETAMAYLQRSLIISQEIRDKVCEVAALNNIAGICRAKGDYKAAFGYLEKCLVINQELGDRAKEGNTLNNMGMIEYARGDYETALRYLEDSLKIRQEIGDVAGVCVTLFNVGYIYRQNGDEEAAYRAWVQVYQMASKIQLANVLDALARLADSLELEGGLDGWVPVAEEME